MKVDDEPGASTVALLEAIAEARTLIDDVTRLSEDLKLRQDRLEELLAPTEAALRARTEYLDRVMREQLGRAEERVSKLGQEVEGIARQLNDRVVQMPSRLAEVFSERWTRRQRHEMWRTALSLVAMLLGGFLAGQVANWRSGSTTNLRAPAEQATSGPKSAPPAPRRPPRSGTRPSPPNVR
jgi:hypothetical protein